MRYTKGDVGYINIFVKIFLLITFVFIGVGVAGDGDMQPVSFEDSRDPLASNGEVSYLVVVKNNRGESAENVEVNLTVPEGFSFLSVNNDACKYNGDNPSDSNDSDLLQCSFDSFAASESVELNITLKAPVIDKATVFELQVASSCDRDVNTDNDVEKVKTTVVKGADLKLSKVGIPKPAISSGIITYEMNVTNSGPHSATGLVLSDQLPEVFSFYADDAVVPTEDDAKWVCVSDDGHNVICKGEDIDVDVTSSFHFRVKITGEETGDITNAATVISDVMEVNTSDNTDTDTINVLPGTDIGVVKKVLTMPVIEDESVTFEINVTNLGQHPAEDVLMEDILQDGYKVDASDIEADGWSCSVSNDNNVSCKKTDTLESKESNIIKITATAPEIDEEQARIDKNVVYVSTSTDDPIVENDKYEVSYIIWADQADLELHKSKSPTPLAVGDIATSTISVHNNGPREASPVQVVDVLDSSEEYDGFEGDGWSCSEEDGNVTCDYDTALAMQEDANPLYIKTKIIADDDNISNRACTGGSGGSKEPDNKDTYTPNDCAAAWISGTGEDYRGVADIRVLKDTTDSVIDSTEDSFDYLINIKNIEGNLSKNIVFNDIVPQYVDAFGSRPATGLSLSSNEINVEENCTINHGEIVCNIGDLDKDEEVNITITVTRPMRDGTLTNTAKAYSKEIGDINRSNNEDSAVVTVENVADIELLSKSVTPTEVLAGTEATYTILIRNNGPSIAKDVNVSDIFSGEEFTFISATPTVGECNAFDETNQELKCSLGDFDSKQVESISIKIRPTHLVPSPDNWEINNTATVTMSTPDSNVSNNSKDVVLPVKEGQVDLSIEIDESALFSEPVPFDPDNSDNNFIVYRVQVDNYGPSYATDVNFSTIVNSVSPDHEQNLTFKYMTLNADGSSDGIDHNCTNEGTTFAPSDTAPTIQCSLGDLESGNGYIGYLVFKIENAPHYVSGDVYHIDGNVTSREVETLYGNNEEDEKTTVRVITDPSIVKKVSKSIVEVGEEFSYTLYIKNYGPGYSPSTNVRDNLPDGMVLVSTPVTTQGSCSGEAGDTSFSCNVDEGDGTLHSKYESDSENDEANITVTVKFIEYPYSGESNTTVTNRAFVTTIAPDKNESNNEDSVDVILLKPAHIGDKVWIDRDADGLQTSEDDGAYKISGMEVYLILDSSDTIVQKTVTDSNGEYGFDINHSDDYRIEFNLTNFSQLHISPQNQGDDIFKDSDINASASTATFHVGYGDNNLSIDAGFYTLVDIGDRVWLDENGNGVQDPSEANVSDINVSLYDDDGTYLESKLTDENGTYKFTGYIPGRYYVVFEKNSLPADHVFTEHVSVPYDKNSDADRITGKTFVKLVKAKYVNKHYFYKHFDAGIYEPVSIGDIVWKDIDGDGIQDSDEDGLKDINITLMDAGCQNIIESDQNGSDDFSSSVLSDENGAYLFDNLKPDTYCLHFESIGDYVITLQDQGDSDSNDSDANGFNTSEGNTTDYVLSSGEDNISADVGFYLQIHLGDRVWDDKDYDGIQDSDEKNISGVKVYLIVDGVLQDGTNGTDEVYEETNESGEYLFDELPPGHTYSVRYTNLPDKYRFTRRDKGDDDNLDSDANETGYSSEVTPKTTSEDENLSFDAGIYKPVVIGDKVWEDMNANGIQDSDEPGLGGVVVTLVIDNVVQNDINVTSEDDGSYIFDESFDLKPNHKYSVVFEKPDDSYEFTKTNIGDDTKDSDANSDGSVSSSTPVMYSGDINITFDAGLYQPAKLGDRIWLDRNGNGIQDSDEDDLSGVDVNITLKKANGDTVATQTVSNGEYVFEDLVPDEYYIEVSLPAGYKLTYQDIDDDSLDSDINQNSFESNHIVLRSGEDNKTLDIGVYQPAKLGDRIWLDKNANGIQDSDEENLSGVEVVVELHLEGNDTAIDTQTIDDGSYLFEDIVPAKYYLKFTLPDGYVVSTKDADNSDDTNDSDINSSTLLSDIVVLNSGQINKTLDMGLFQPAKLGDRIWLDKNANGIQDSDESNFTDGNVTVYIEDENGNAIVDVNGNDVNPVETDSGVFVFENLKPGSYHLRYEFPQDVQVSPLHKGSDRLVDSDVYKDTNKTDDIVLTSGQTDTSVDVGLYTYASIGDYVWIDDNGNGIQDDSKILDVNVTVELYKSDDTLVDTKQVVEGSDGSYLFDGIDPDEYYVVFKLPTDSKYRFTSMDSTDDTLDSDVNLTTSKTSVESIESGEHNDTIDAGIYIPVSIGDRVWLDANADGIQDANDSNISDINVTLYDKDDQIVSQVTTDENGTYLFDGLVPGEYYIKVALVDNADNRYVVTDKLSVQSDANNSDINESGYSEHITLSSAQYTRDLDAGLYIPVSIGDYVWDDANGNGIQDSDEDGIEGLEVVLYRVEDNGSSTKINTQETNATGAYLFEGLKPDSYYVTVQKPQHYSMTSKDVGSDDSIDSDFNTSTLQSDTVVLVSPEDNLSIDAGFYKLANITGEVTEDTDNDDAGDTALGGVTIELRDADGNVVETNITDSDGKFEFLDVEPGRYTIVEIQPSGMVSISENEGGNDNDAGNDSLDNQISVVVEIAENDTGNDFVEEKGIAIGDRIWFDENGDGIQDDSETNTSMLQNIELNLYKDGVYIATTYTDEDGMYIFDNYYDGNYSIEVNLSTLPEHYGVTKQDQTDDDNDSDFEATTYTNIDHESVMSEYFVLLPDDHNMSFDMGIYRLGSVLGQVLVDMDGDNEVGGANDDVLEGVQIDLVDSEGNVVATTYTDENGNYKFEDVPQGDYSIIEHQPVGYLDINSTGGDSVSDDANTIYIHVGAGEDDTNNNFNDKLGSKIGNYVWNDTDELNGANGIQDSDENGTNGVKVCLEDSEGNPIVVSEDNDTQRCTETNATGYYNFIGLVPGDYVVVFTIPNGTDLTPEPRAGNYKEDSNPIETEWQDGHLVAKAEVSLDIGEKDETIDMGLVYLGTASIGDYVWIDSNQNGIQDDGEKGLDGVHLILYDAKGKKLEEYVTHSGGYYRFEHLYKGKYTIKVIPPKDWLFTTKDSKESDNADSDVNPSTGKIIEIELKEGEYQKVWDVGLYCPCQGKINKSDSGSSMNILGALLLMLLSIFIANRPYHRKEV